MLFRSTAQRDGAPEHHITLVERGDTVTENAIMAAARTPGLTVIRNASGNYMVQDLCFFLRELGVGVDGIGTTTLRIQGVKEINKDVEYHISEDPIEAMSLITAGIVTRSELTVKRCPIEFLEVEFAVLEEMGQDRTLRLISGEIEDLDVHLSPGVDAAGARSSVEAVNGVANAAVDRKSVV